MSGVQAALTAGADPNTTQYCSSLRVSTTFPRAPRAGSIIPDFPGALYRLFVTQPLFLLTLPFRYTINILPLNECNDRSSPPLDWAIYQGRIEMVRLLLQRGAKIRSYKELSMAVSQGHWDIARLLMRKGAPISSYGGSLLEDAARYPGAGLARELVAYGTSIQPYAVEPLLEAIRRNNHELVVYLLELGVDPNGSKNGDISLPLAFFKNPDNRIVKILLKHGADPRWQDAVSRRRYTLVERAFTKTWQGKSYQRQEQEAQLVEMLVRHGAPIRAEAFRQAVRWDRLDVFRILRKYRKKKVWTPVKRDILCDAIRAPSPRMLRVLLQEEGIDPNRALCYKTTTPLSDVVFLLTQERCSLSQLRHFRQLATLLLRYGANPDLSRSYRGSPRSELHKHGMKVRDLRR
ncbi:MAG: hypothetical protein AAF518_09400 [Spirochaetota bacterium]